jgi:hypothetical protein
MPKPVGHVCIQTYKDHDGSDCPCLEIRRARARFLSKRLLVSTAAQMAQAVLVEVQQQDNLVSLRLSRLQTRDG